MTLKTKARAASPIFCFTGSNGELLTPDQYREKIRTNPTAYLRDQLGVNPWGDSASGQIQIIESVRDHRRTIVKGCIASSKTCAAAMVTHWFLQSHYPARVFTLAPTFRQVKLNLWGEIRRFYGASKIPIGGDLAPVACELKIMDDLYAIGFSTNEPDRVHGIHGANDLLILDELQGFKREMIEAIENALAGGNSKVLALCNPNVLTGEAYEAFHSKRALYNCISISAYDTPNVKEGRVIVPGMITREQAVEWEKVYGRDSNFVRVKVYAEFPKQEDDTLIPLDWIESAMARELEPGPKISYGVDVARFGSDRTVTFPMAGRVGGKYTARQGNDLMATTGETAVLLRNNVGSLAGVDSCGIGAGVVDRLAELGLSVLSINVAERPDDPVKFHDKRSELWFMLREALDPDNPAAISLEKDPDLIAEISSVKFKITSSGKIKVESKDEMKKRLGKSPDIADALCLSLYTSRTINAGPIILRETKKSGLELEAVGERESGSFLSGFIE